MDNTPPHSWEDASIRHFAMLTMLEIDPSNMAGRPSGNDSEKAVFADIVSKLNLIPGCSILDVGSGCGPLTELLCNYAEHREMSLTLFDQTVVNERLVANYPHLVNKAKFVNGVFPNDKIELETRKFDRILLYGVLHYFSNPKSILLDLIDFLNPGGSMLVGDLPNFDKKERLLNSQFGKRLNSEFQQQNNLKDLGLEFNGEIPKIRDQLVLDILETLRSLNFNAYVLPQNNNLPFAFSREDLLIERLPD